MISAGAKVLGSFKIGDNSKIGAGSVVLEEVPCTPYLSCRTNSACFAVTICSGHCSIGCCFDSVSLPQTGFHSGLLRFPSCFCRILTVSAMNVKPATTHPLATNEICGMLDMIQTLVDKGYAYRL